MQFGKLGQLGRPAISFELFPPKNAAAEARLDEALPRLLALAPDLMTVTYGALGSTREKTLDAARRLQQEFGVPTACHLTCVGSTRAELDGLLDRIHAAGIRNIVALRGDPPKGADGGISHAFRAPEGGCRYASELVAHIHDWERRRGAEPFGLAVAGYPEKHVEAPDAATDLLNLKNKLAAGAHAVVTQLFFDNCDYFDFVRRARALGIAAPIVPGLMPIVSAKQVKTMTAMCGAKVPPDLEKALDAAGENAEEGMAIGVEHCLAQARELLAEGAPGIHFYVLNRADHMEQIMAGLQAKP